MPVNQSRHAPLTSIATSAQDSHPDLSSTYHDDSKRPSVSSGPLPQSPGLAQSPARPYAPGMRSSISSPKRPNIEESAANGEIPMQSFADGAPPPPPVSHSWKKIDRWTENHYEELYDQLCEGCTQNDINELEHELDMSLPQDVRESFSIHDGQERGGRPTGIIFGCMLLDCEEVVQEWKNWKTVNEEYLSEQKRQQAQYPIKALNNGSSSSAAQAQSNHSKVWRQELLDKQDSQPPGATQKVYAHPQWISLARDWGGNNIAIDLAPGPTGKWGQVILFGRDYDCKYVIAKSWSHFLANVADDISSDKVFVDEETQELKLKEFKTETVEPAYMDILRWRADQRYGRRNQRRKTQPPPGLNTNVNGQNGRSSPYGSPTTGNEDRGRSQQRFSRGSNASPRHAVGSPLARVQEEMAHPALIRGGGDVVKDFALDTESPATARKERLVDVPTPIDTKPTNKNKLVDAPTPVLARGEKKEFPASNLSRSTTRDLDDDDKENKGEMAEPVVKGLGLNVDGVEDEMKNVAI